MIVVALTIEAGTLMFTATGVLFVAWQTLVMRRATQLDHERRRRESTMSHLQVARERLAVDLYMIKDALGAERLTEAQVTMIDDGHHGELQKCTQRLLSNLEFLAVGVKADVLDFDVMVMLSGTFLVHLFEKFRAYVEIHRPSQPKLLVEMEALAARIKREIGLP